FFTIASAKLDLSAIPEVWIIALVYIVVRALSMFGATQLGVQLVNSSEKIRTYLWYGMFAQAGVTLTIVEIAANKGLPWATQLQTTIMATILFNIIVGPTLLKIGLTRSGEAATPEEIASEDEAKPDDGDPDDSALQRLPAVHFPEPVFESAKLTEQLERLQQRLRTIAVLTSAEAIQARSQRLEQTFTSAQTAILAVLTESLEDLAEASEPIEALPPGTNHIAAGASPPGADRSELKRLLRNGRLRLAEAMRQLIEAEGIIRVDHDPMEQTLQDILDQLEAVCADQLPYITVAQEDARFVSDDGDGLATRLVKALKSVGRKMGGFRTRTIPFMALSRYHIELKAPGHLIDTANLMGSQRIYTWQKILIFYKLAESIYIEGLEFLDDAPVLWRRTVEELFAHADTRAAEKTADGEEGHEKKEETDKPAAVDTEPTEAAIEALEAELRGIPEQLEDHRPAVLELKDFFGSRIADLRGDHQNEGEFAQAHQDLQTYHSDVERSVGHALALPYRALLKSAEKAGTFELPPSQHNPSRAFDQSHKDRLKMMDAVQNWRQLFHGFTNRFELQMELVRIEGQLRQTLTKTLAEVERELLATLAYYPTELTEQMREVRSRIETYFEPGAMEPVELRKALGRERTMLLSFLHDTVLEDIQEVRESRRFDDLLDHLRTGLRQITESALPTIQIASEDDIGANSESALSSINLKDVPLKDVLHEALEREVSGPLSDADMRLKILLDRVLTEFTDLGRVISFNLDAAASEMVAKPGTPSQPGPRLQLASSERASKRDDAPAQGIALAREFALGGLDRSIERLEGLLEHIDEIKELIDALVLKETVRQIRRVRELVSDDSHNAIRAFIAQRDLALASGLASARSTGIAGRALDGLKAFDQKRLKPIRDLLIRGVREGLDLEEEGKPQTLTLQLARLDDQLDRWGDSDLPNIYRRLFSPNATELSDFFISRPEVIDSFNRAVEQWLHRRFTTIAIVGEPGAGRQSFIEQALQSRLDGMPIIRRRLVHTIYTEHDLAEELSSIAGGRRTQNLTQLKAKLSRRRDRAVIILEGAENLFLRSLDGMKTLQKFLHLVSDTGETLLWIITMDVHAWNYLEAVQQIGHQFTHPLVLRPLSRSELREMILTRHRASGYNLMYTNTIEGWRQLRLMAAQLLNKDEDRQAVLEDAYFDKLYALSRGNPMLAIYYWVQSLQSESDHLLRVLPLEPIAVNFLKTLDTETMLALSSIVLHNGLTVREFAEVFSTDEARAQALLQYLLHLRLVQIEPGTENMFRLNRILYNAVSERLKQHNML
ncbi:MAG: hypothetical protein AAFS10_01590, partial [Myxococcota bacterium]